MRWLREQLIMADSVAEISRLEADEKMIEKLAKNKVHDEKAPAAATKLEGKGRVANKLTVKEIEAVLCKVYSITLGGSHRKIDYVKALENEMASSIGKYEDYLRLLAADNAAIVPPALAAIEDVRTAESEEEVEDLALNAIGNVEVEGSAEFDNTSTSVDSEDVGEWELVDDNADNMDGGVLETDDANYDDQDGKEYTHDTGLIDANVMDNDKSEDNELPARFKECYF
jgi:hypothetical protein